ncbi:ATP-binding protein, partial [Nocardiopsis tropica]|nr:ATP-binding protein [Nocardiopsis tropica]
VREPLEVSPEVPIIDFDARNRLSGGDVLKALLRYALEHNRTSEPVA